MKSLLRLIWNGKASKTAAALSGTLTYLIARDSPIPHGWLVGLGGAAAFFSLIAGPSASSPPPKSGRLP